MNQAGVDAFATFTHILKYCVLTVGIGANLFRPPTFRCVLLQSVVFALVVGPGPRPP